MVEDHHVETVDKDHQLLAAESHHQLSKKKTLKKNMYHQLLKIRWPAENNHQSSTVEELLTISHYIQNCHEQWTLPSVDENDHVETVENSYLHIYVYYIYIHITCIYIWLYMYILYIHILHVYKSSSFWRITLKFIVFPSLAAATASAAKIKVTAPKGGTHSWRCRKLCRVDLMSNAQQSLHG